MFMPSKLNGVATPSINVTVHNDTAHNDTAKKDTAHNFPLKINSAIFITKMIIFKSF